MGPTRVLGLIPENMLFMCHWPLYAAIHRVDESTRRSGDTIASLRPVIHNKNYSQLYYLRNENNLTNLKFHERTNIFALCKTSLFFITIYIYHSPLKD